MTKLFLPLTHAYPPQVSRPCSKNFLYLRSPEILLAQPPHVKSPARYYSYFAVLVISGTFIFEHGRVATQFFTIDHTNLPRMTYLILLPRDRFRKAVSSRNLSLTPVPLHYIGIDAPPDQLSRAQAPLGQIFNQTSQLPPFGVPEHSTHNCQNSDKNDPSLIRSALYTV